MPTQAIWVPISEDARAVIEGEARRSGRELADVASELLAEAAKMQRVPGIVFADGPCGRRARIAGTGLEVFELIGGYKSVGGDWANFCEAYHWLSEAQLRAALAYCYEAYPEEIDELLQREGSWTPEKVWAMYPQTKPVWR